MWPGVKKPVSALLAIGTAALYLPRLQDAPIFALRDEIYFALTAHSVAFTGRDPSGIFLPVYFPIGPAGHPLMWFQPMLLYAIALVLRMMPFTEGTIRLPMVAAAVVDVVLVYLVARRLCKRELPAIAAAVLLALSPAHFMFARTALDYQAPLPFILGWLLCVLQYQSDRKPRQLLAAGALLGLGMFTLITAHILMPFYAVLTCGVLYTRREPIARWLWLAAGFLVPAGIGAVFVAAHPAVIHDVVMRYQPGQSVAVGNIGAIQAFLQTHHLGDAVSVYWSFWNPRLLFVNGRDMMTGVGGVFLLPMAGAFVVGLVRALRRLDAMSVLLLAGLLTAPLAASFVNEPEAIRRTLVMLPFMVLLAAYGLDSLWSADSMTERRLAFVAMWGVVIYLAATYRDDLPYAQAYIRAATVPLALAGLATLLRGFAVARLPVWRIASVSALVLGLMQVAYYAGTPVMLGTLGLMATIALAPMLRGKALVERIPFGQEAAIALLACLASEFVYFYVDFSPERNGAVPASVVLMVIRLLCSATVLVATIVFGTLLRRISLDRLPRWQLVSLASVVLVVIQVAYFYIGHFPDARVRYQQIAALTIALVGLAVLLRGVATARMRLGQFAVAAMLGLAVIQFTYFYADYFDGFRIRRSSTQEGNVSLAYDAVLEHDRSVPIPAVYLAYKFESPFLRELYWRFSLLKHERQDLLARTVNDDASGALDARRVADLPDGAVVITGASAEIYTTIEQLVSAGQVKRDTLVRAADGAAVFWILERSEK